MTAVGSDDGGLQAERTVLAWRRTALTAAVVMVLALRAWILRPSPATLITLVLGATLVGVLAANGSRRSRSSGAMLSISVLVSVTGIWMLTNSTA